MIIADSDVLIDFLRGKGAAERVALELKTGRLATTAISAFEIWSGAKTANEAARVEILIEALNVIGLEKASARKAGEVRRDLEKKGEAIGMADSLIAGICMEQGALLLTRNQRHFERVEGLKLSNVAKA